MTGDPTSPADGRPRPPGTGADDPESVCDRVRSLWSAELGRSGFDDGEDVLDLGATSLQVARVLAALRTQYAVRIPLAAFFDHPSVRGLARAVLERRVAAAPQ